MPIGQSSRRHASGNEFVNRLKANTACSAVHGDFFYLIQSVTPSLDIFNPHAPHKIDSMFGACYDAQAASQTGICMWRVSGPPLVKEAFETPEDRETCEVLIVNAPKTSGSGSPNSGPLDESYCLIVIKLSLTP